MSSAQLTAAYKSPDSTRNFSLDLPSLPEDPKALGTREKTVYLSALRSNISKMQDDMNAFLTQKMEEEKADGGNADIGKKKTREEQEEEMYGEEDPEEET